ncbi:MAG: RNA polymerase sigma factor, partial [Actinomycetota bacterium]|nr:RNA polymerase sigma factor [Actinomycetota bacterium]
MIGTRQKSGDVQRVPPGQKHSEFIALYEQHARTIHRYLARRLSTELADDLTADTFLIALRRWQSYDHDQGPPIAWLYGIATNLVRNHRRRERAELLAIRRLEALPVDPVDPADGIVARVDASEQARELAVAIAGLSQADRDVLLLVAWTELSYEQVAQALDIPIGTVRSRLHRVRRQLRIAHDSHHSD